MIETLIEQARKIQAFIIDISLKNDNGHPISYEERRLLNEALKSYYVLGKFTYLTDYDRTVVLKTFNLGHDVIFEKLLHFGNYYYSYSTLKHKDIFEKQTNLQRTNVETASMITRIYAYELKLDGLGASAHSYYQKKRSWNFADIHKYFQQIQEGRYYEEIENLSEKESFNEYIMLSLRTKKGIDKKKLVTYNELYVDEFYNRLKSIKSNYYIENTSFIKITEEAFFVSDDIIFRLFI